MSWRRTLAKRAIEECRAASQGPAVLGRMSYCCRRSLSHSPLTRHAQSKAGVGPRPAATSGVAPKKPIYPLPHRRGTSPKTSKGASDSGTSGTSSTSPASTFTFRRGQRIPFFGAAVMAMGIGLWVGLYGVGRPGSPTKGEGSGELSEAELAALVDPLCTCGHGATVGSSKSAATETAATAAAAAAAAGPTATATPTVGLPPSLIAHRTSALQFDRALDAEEAPSVFDVFLSGMLFRGDGGGGVAALRRDLATHARGHVLEVAVGTGRNLPSLDWKGMALAIKEDEEDRNVQARKSETKDSGPARSWFGWFGKGAPSQANDDSGLDGRMRSYTGIDLSLAVLELARDRLRAAVRKVPEMKSLPPELLGEAAILEAGGEPARQRSAGGWNGLLRLVHGDVLQGVPPPPPASWHQARAAGPADKDAGLPSKGSEASPSASATPLPKYYDTILSTFSLCSLDSPTVLLAHLARSLAPGTGRIHLVEHGRAPSPFPSWWPTLSSHSSSSASSVSNSSSSASPVSNSSSPAPPVSGSSSWWSRWTSSPGDGVNARLDAGAAHHYARFGCWWNRDIEALVRAAVEEINTSHGSSSDIGGRLEIVTVRRPQPIRQLGTIVWIELRVVPRGEATSTAAKKTSEATG